MRKQKKGKGKETLPQAARRSSPAATVPDSRPVVPEVEPGARKRFVEGAVLLWFGLWDNSDVSGGGKGFVGTLRVAAAIRLA